MQIEHQLIELYLWVCEQYDMRPELYFQRLSDNPTEPELSDQELVTIYLFGHLQERLSQKAIHRYMAIHWDGWFPHLPSYQAFNRRLTQIFQVWPVMLEELMCNLAASRGITGEREIDQVLDSLPIMPAVRGCSTNARVAREQANKGYCDSKKIWYHGIKLHVHGARQYQLLPLPLSLCQTPASCHDLTVLKDETLVPLTGNLFANKAYCDQTTEQRLAAQGTTLCTPEKMDKGQTVYHPGQSGLWSRFVSSMRQPIESFFNWLIQKTGIQNASRVRSSAGLRTHCYGKLVAALYLFFFQP